jgi:hypothetical protein
MNQQRLIPLQLYEVLENEFISLHGRLPDDYPNWTLKHNQIDFGKLQQAFHPASITPVALELKEILSETLRKILPNKNKNDEWLQNLHQIENQSHFIFACNNKLSSKEVLYNTNLLASDSELRLLETLKTNGQPFNTEEITFLNRLLIEAALPSAILKISVIRFKAIRDRIHLLPEGRSALCLSGGGIRSAAYGLGILQGLAQQGLLDKFDFLSTVSGGGYIGSWLSAWIHRHPDGLSGVSNELARKNSPSGNLLDKVPFQTEPRSTRFLRAYSRYLNPKSGFFSADTWTWIGIYLRNLLLNWVAIVPVFLFLLAIPRLYVTQLTPDFFEAYSPSTEKMKQIEFWLASASAVLAILCATLSRPSDSDRATETSTIPRRKLLRFGGLRERLKTQPWILTLGVFPLVIFSCLLTLVIKELPSIVEEFYPAPFIWIGQWLPFSEPFSELMKLPISLMLWGESIVVLSWLFCINLLPPRPLFKRCTELLAMLVAGAITWGMLGWLAGFTRFSLEGQSVVSFFSFPARLTYAVLAGPLVIAVSLVGMTLFIGFVSKFTWIDDEDYEWWARFGGWLLIVATSWLVINITVIIGPIILIQSPKIMAAAGGTSGLVAILLGKSSLTSALLKIPAFISKKPGYFFNFGTNMLAIAATIFICIFLAFLSLVSTAFLNLLAGIINSLDPTIGASFPLQPIGNFEFGAGCVASSDALPEFSLALSKVALIHLDILCLTPPQLVLSGMLIILLIAMIASWSIDLNKFSLHGAYRNRLIRTFLGASRDDDRKPNPFTGFDPVDDMQMHELQAGLLREADITNLTALLMALKTELEKKAMDSAVDNSLRCATARAVISSLRNKELVEQLKAYEPQSKPLKTLQRNLIEGLNRVIESPNLLE